jgi:hypothetical protein
MGNAVKMCERILVTPDQGKKFVCIQGVKKFSGIRHFMLAPANKVC